MEDAQITTDMIVFPQTLHGVWNVNVSIYQQTQIMVMASHRIEPRTIIEFFYHPNDAAEFIEFLDQSGEYYE